ncbi:hypothetical protein CJ673_11605 [Aliarcobacter cryaerophilus]|uniref:Uncharacterized protein n=1 Tax=Aliarcobacter cryaerophilus TaxID=28198 RepID=A0A2S9SXD2_9BACT|nr:hypothetical protein CJ673_11605 [Aliarcobacter cryaerophilus]
MAMKCILKFFDAKLISLYNLVDQTAPLQISHMLKNKLFSSKKQSRYLTKHINLFIFYAFCLVLLCNMCIFVFAFLVVQIIILTIIK